MRIAGLIGFSCLFLGQPSAAQTAEESPSPYLDAQGEEIFGPDNMPTSPENVGEPLLVGQPNGGVQIAPSLRTLGQGNFKKAAEAWSPPEATNPETRLPLLKSVRDANKLQRWRAEPEAMAPMLAPPSAGAVKEMTVHYVYVGQGSGAILEFPCGVAVVDTGGEYGSGDNGGKMFVDYLDKFFEARPTLNRTIDVLFTSHPHMDHNYGLRLMKFSGPDGFTIRNFVDNGQTGTKSPLKPQTELRETIRAGGAKYSAVQFKSQVFATGLTNAVIDPIKCPGIDPKLTAFWGGRNEAVATRSGYTSPNNHSLLLRVDFGDGKLLFLGDLMTQGAEDLLEEYEDNPKAFDVDVFLSAHHGAENGTSDAILRAMSPQIGIISMGDKSSTKPSTAFDHGHPRMTTINLMQNQPDIVSGKRTPIDFWAAEAEETPFKKVRVSQAIYGTGWEGTLLLKVRSDGTYKVVKP